MLAVERPPIATSAGLRAAVRWFVKRSAFPEVAYSISEPYICRPPGGPGPIPRAMAKKAKGSRVQVILECTEHKTSGQPGTSRYITTKNRKNTTERIELKKYNPILRRMTAHKEIK